MPVYFSCPHCGLKTELPERFAGLAGPCTQCGKSVNIPPVGVYYPPKSHRATTAVIIVLVGFLGVSILVAGLMVALLLPAVSAGRDAAKQVACTRNLKQIALAIQGYEQTYGCFPPAYVADEKGTPMHSWRVLLLPFLDQKDLYDRYRFDEPWDSPNNRKVTDLALGVYQCPAQPGTKDPTTNYMMVVGPHTVSNGAGSQKTADITDGLKDTILLVEVADSSTWWAEPIDLRFENMSFAINAGKRQEISSYHRGGANVALCDGAVSFLSDSYNPNLVKAMLTIDGGEHASSD